MKLMLRYQHLLAELCAPYAYLHMLRRHNGYRIAVLVADGLERTETKLGYETAMKWLELGWLIRVQAPIEKYEITALGRDIAARYEKPEPEAPRYKWLQAGEQARKALGK
jgi:hypothetical protein